MFSTKTTVERRTLKASASQEGTRSITLTFSGTFDRTKSDCATGTESKSKEAKDVLSDDEKNESIIFLLLGKAIAQLMIIASLL